jgi:hypothetical protein
MRGRLYEVSSAIAAWLGQQLGTFTFTDGRDADHPAVVQVVKNGSFAVYQ